MTWDPQPHTMLVCVHNNYMFTLIRYRVMYKWAKNVYGGDV